MNDSNFEQNRIEYKTQKEAAERNAKLGIKASPQPVEKSKYSMVRIIFVTSCVCSSAITEACGSQFVEIYGSFS